MSLIVGLTLPNDQRVPSIIREAFDDLPISSSVCFQFRPPVILATLRRTVEAAPFVAMPETAVYEYHRASVAENDVRSARKIGGMQPIAVA
jgi:hypothetical protein